MQNKNFANLDLVSASLGTCPKDLTDKLIQDIIQWDIQTWKKAIVFWNTVIDDKISNPHEKTVLDIGARDGGLSLFFAKKGFMCICSDLNEPTQSAHSLHAAYGISSNIKYEAVDCTDIPYASDSIDVVCFKSILGGVGSNSHDEKTQKALDEIFRILKPGGFLFFAENLKSSWLHQFSRRYFVKWGKRWNYMDLDTISRDLNRYSQKQLLTYGFFGCFKKDNSMLGTLDRIVCKNSFSDNHYMCYGYAIK